MPRIDFLRYLIAFAIATSAHAQTSATNSTLIPPSRLTFASATVEPSPSFDFSAIEPEMKAGKLPTTPTAGTQVDVPMVKLYARSRQELIMLAYNVKIYQLSGPDWLPDKRFDIVATMPDGASVGDVPAMLQALLEDRFKLVAHRETKNRAILALKVAKSGPNLLSVAVPQTGRNRSSNPLERTTRTPAGPIGITTNGHDGSTLTFSSATMDGLAEILTYLLHGGYDNLLAGRNVTEAEGDWQVVVNETGLKGEYQLAVNSSLIAPTIESRIADDIGGSSPITTHDTLGPAKAIDEGDPMTYSSLQRLGLELERSSVKAEMPVIRHAEKNPSTN